MSARVRQVIGKATHELDAAAWAGSRGDRRLMLDLGTGDGKHVLAEARRRPDEMVVGLDAGPDAMRKTAQRAAAKVAKGGVPNAVFVWAAAEALPPELSDVDELHCLMPWGSLLRALVRPDVDVLRNIAQICVAGAPFLVTLNLHAWRPPVVDVDGTPEPTPASVLDDLAPRYAEAGWTITAADYPDALAIAELGTSWTKRLGSTRDELAVLRIVGQVAR